jgi:hypothetical protein
MILSLSEICQIMYKVVQTPGNLNYRRKSELLGVEASSASGACNRTFELGCQYCKKEMMSLEDDIYPRMTREEINRFIYYYIVYVAKGRRN